jgi:streptomycin 6-kinase
MSGLGLPQPRRLEMLCDLAATVWRRTDADLPTGAQKAARLADGIRRRWAELGEPCARRTVEHALAAAESRRHAHDPARAVLLHGDVHQWNALRSGAGFRLVDPDGVVAEPECDLGVLMREDPVELTAGDPWDRVRLLAARTGTDPLAIWEWGVAERAATGLALTALGVQPVAAQMLAAADAISRRAASAG